MTEPVTYTIKFERIGRRYDIADLVVITDDVDDLSAQIYAYARPYLGSRDIDVILDLENHKGYIFCGMRTGSQFTVDFVEPPMNLKTRFELAGKEWAEFLRKLTSRRSLPKLKKLLTSKIPFSEN